MKSVNTSEPIHTTKLREKKTCQLTNHSGGAAPHPVYEWNEVRVDGWQCEIVQQTTSSAVTFGTFYRLSSHITRPPAPPAAPLPWLQRPQLTARGQGWLILPLRSTPFPQNLARLANSRYKTIDLYSSHIRNSHRAVWVYHAHMGAIAWALCVKKQYLSSNWQQCRPTTS